MICGINIIISWDEQFPTLGWSMICHCYRGNTLPRQFLFSKLDGFEFVFSTTQCSNSPKRASSNDGISLGPAITNACPQKKNSEALLLIGHALLVIWHTSPTYLALLPSTRSPIDDSAVVVLLRSIQHAHPLLPSGMFQAWQRILFIFRRRLQADADSWRIFEQAADSVTVLNLSAFSVVSYHKASTPTCFAFLKGWKRPEKWTKKT